MSEPLEPPSMSRRKAIAYVVSIPAVLLALLFLPAGSIAWRPGWIFLAVVIVAYAVTALVLWRVNPAIFKARSRFQPGTKGWDRVLLAVMLPMMVAIVPVAALDAGRFGWSSPPLWAILAGYAALLSGIAITAWAQAVNPFFEPGVRIQSERHQRVIDTGPYRLVRHPGYSSALMLSVGIGLALGSFWALVPAALAGAVLVLRTVWEDRLLQAELPGYMAFAARVRWRLIPGLW
jgi:protein-S-isoprenylcysteine O-methyltransferase Ste14